MSVRPGRVNPRPDGPRRPFGLRFQLRSRPESRQSSAIRLGDLVHVDRISNPRDWRQFLEIRIRTHLASVPRRHPCVSRVLERRPVVKPPGQAANDRGAHRVEPWGEPRRGAEHDPRVDARHRLHGSRQWRGQEPVETPASEGQQGRVDLAEIRQADTLARVIRAQPAVEFHQVLAPVEVAVD